MRLHGIGTNKPGAMPQDGCTRGWGLCLTSAGSLMRTYGAYYTDLPSNMLGSFIMGCLATSSSLGLAVDKVQQGLAAKQTVLCPVISSPGRPASSLVRTQNAASVSLMPQAVGILPAAHPWQGNAPLLAGLRTGYCGSLTTFSAWQLQCVLLLVGGRGRQGGQWDQVRHFPAACSTRAAQMSPHTAATCTACCRLLNGAAGYWGCLCFADCCRYVLVRNVRMSG